MTRVKDARHARAAAAVAGRYPVAPPKPPKPKKPAKPKKLPIPRQLSTRPAVTDQGVLLRSMIRAMLAALNRWQDPAELARAVQFKGAAVTPEQIVEAADSARGGRIFDRAPGQLRLHTLTPAIARGIGRRCTTCGAVFHIDGLTLSRFNARSERLPRICAACVSKPGLAGRQALEIVLARAADEAKHMKAAHEASAHRGLPLTQEVVPGEGPGTPGGCIHGLERAICRTCGRPRRK